VPAPASPVSIPKLPGEHVRTLRRERDDGAGGQLDRAARRRPPALDQREEETPPVHALRKRSGSLKPILAQLHALDEEGILDCPLPDVLASLAHLAVNRLLKRSGSIEEARVHHALVRAYEAELGRARLGARAAPR
jgi:hypothetical protein